MGVCRIINMWAVNSVDRVLVSDTRSHKFDSCTARQQDIKYM